MGKIKSKETKLEKSVWKILSEHGDTEKIAQNILASPT